MAENLIFNPLLKKGFQYSGGGGGDNSQKVTKFFCATDTLEDGEIAQYQGVNDNNLINGFFYKVDVTPITIIPAGTPYFYFTKPFESDVFNIIANDRYYLIESNVFTLNNNFAWSPDNPTFFYPYQYIAPASIGNPVYCEALKQYKLITAINGDTIVCDDISFIYGGHLSGPFTFSKYINQDGQVIFVSPAAYAVIYIHNNLQYGFARQVLSPVPSIQQGSTNQQITLGGNKFTRVDTQPSSSYTLPIAAANVLGGVKVGSGLSIDANGVLSVGGGNIYAFDVESLNADVSVMEESAVAYYYNGLLFYYVNIFVSDDISSGAIFRFYTKSSRPYQFQIASVFTLPIPIFDDNSDVIPGNITLTQGSDVVSIVEGGGLFHETEFWLYGSFPCSLTAL